MAKNFDTTIEGTLPMLKVVGQLNTNLPAYIGGATEIVGATTLDSTLNVTGLATLSGGVSTTGAQSSTGIITAVANTAIGGTAVQAFGISSTSNFGIYFGNQPPTVVPISAGTGSLYLNYGGTGVASRLYVNTSGGTGWTAVTTVA